MSTVDNPRCPGTNCLDSVINSCPPSCPGSQTNPHYVCIGGECHQVNDCGTSNGGCTQSQTQCECPSGQTRPYYRCDSGGDCQQQSGNGCGESNCTPGYPCQGPCDQGRVNPHRMCVSGDCEAVPGCGYEDCVSNRQDCDILDGYWNSHYCYCQISPILVDVSGNGFTLTSAADGVLFDLDCGGPKERLSWTAPNSDDSFLVLDRNNNGTIDDGKELFGSLTPQSIPPSGQKKNGFLALAEFDKIMSGGNNDGRMDSRDGVFVNLRVWQDVNHNGLSEPSELRTLPEVGLTGLDLKYKESKKADQHGNQFKYRAKTYSVHGSNIEKWASDVYLVRGQ